MNPPVVAFRMALLDLLVAQLGAAEVLLQQLLVVLDRGLDHLVPGGLDPFLVRLGNRQLGEGLAQGLLVEHHLDPPDDVDVPGEHLARAHRQLNRIGLLGEPIPDHGHAAIEVGSDPVHLVGEDETGNPVAIGLAPDGLGLGLDTGHRVEQRDGAVEHAEGALYFDGEIDVARGIDDVDAVGSAVPVPEAGGGGGGNGDSALLLLLHPVHGGRALVHLTDLVVLAGVVEDPLGRSRLPGIDVGHDADVAIQIEGCLSCHSTYP